MRDNFWNRPGVTELGGGWRARLLSAWEAMEARAEAETLAAEGRDPALCANACLLARALLRRGRPAFAGGKEVLEGMTAGQIGELARRWSAFDRESNPSVLSGEETVEQAKKAWSTRRKSAFGGACSKHFTLCLPRRGSGR
ncbi:MAG: hypothetical protein MR272_07925 [Pseudoflavonifractor sp.]|nr:hypothetical protein [Pseudoflavonifractor sp.]MDY3019822.1 hypothetical protein [Oscillospiraceae bacterium]